MTGEYITLHKHSITALKTQEIWNDDDRASVGIMGSGWCFPQLNFRRRCRQIIAGQLETAWQLVLWRSLHTNCLQEVSFNDVICMYFQWKVTSLTVLILSDVTWLSIICHCLGISSHFQAPCSPSHVSCCDMEAQVYPWEPKEDAQQDVKQQRIVLRNWRHLCFRQNITMTS